MTEPDRPHPTYELIKVKACIRAKHYRPSGEAGEGALELDFGLAGMCQCYEDLADSDFRKSMFARQPPYAWMDVYKPIFRGVQVYTKFRLDKYGRVHIVSFKEA